MDLRFLASTFAAVNFVQSPDQTQNSKLILQFETAIWWSEWATFKKVDASGANKDNMNETYKDNVL